MYIYALVCPKTRQVRYIGRTAKKPGIRLSAHVSASKTASTKSPLARWIVGLLNEGLRPDFVILRDFDTMNGPYWEAYYYEQHESSGLLLNQQVLSSVKHSEFAVMRLIKACEESGKSKKELAAQIGANYGDICSFLKGFPGQLSGAKIQALMQFIDELRPQVMPF